MQSLVQDMVQDDPMKRPTIDEVVRRFSEIWKTLSWWKLRSRLVDKEKRVGSMSKMFKVTMPFVHMFSYVLTFSPAVPLP